MPQLSDSMDEGKLIAWKVAVGEHVKSGDVIAEVESDKAIMELQTFKDGVVTQLLLQEGDEAEVGSVIARIDTNAKEGSVVREDELQSKPKKDIKQKPKEQVKTLKKEELEPQKKVEHIEKELSSGISPKARAKASEYGLDMEALMQKSQKSVVHVEDVQRYLNERYFTPKALKLLHKYHLQTSLFKLDHKVDEAEVQKYINEHEIPLPQPLSAMQKAIVANVTASAKKPIFHIYDSLDAKLFEQHKEQSITVWLLKIFAKVMMEHESFRSLFDNETISVYPNASISLAVADKKDLYMPVVKDINKLNLDAIAKELEGFKTKLKSRSFKAEDMQGGTFGISNLGMLGIERFDAMINKNESAIVAVGAIKEGKLAIILTADHRVINGYEAALFINDVKKEAQNPLNFKE